MALPSASQKAESIYNHIIEAGLSRILVSHFENQNTILTNSLEHTLTARTSQAGLDWRLNWSPWSVAFSCFRFLHLRSLYVLELSSPLQRHEQPALAGLSMKIPLNCTQFLYSLRIIDYRACSIEHYFGIVLCRNLWIENKDSDFGFRGKMQNKLYMENINTKNADNDKYGIILSIFHEKESNQTQLKTNLISYSKQEKMRKTV